MTNKTLYDVIVVGAGPVGLLLACELALARASVLVLERDCTADSPWKADPLGFRGLNTQSLESLHRRGLLDKIVDVGKRPLAPNMKKGASFQSGGTFAGIMLDAGKLDLDRYKYCMPGPALLPSPIIVGPFEQKLTEHAEALGVCISRGGGGFARIAAQDTKSVTVETEAGERLNGRWLVGCDGARSAVRKAAGIEFTGTEARFTGYAAHCDLDHPERLKPGFHPTDNGMYIFRPPNMIYLTDFDGGAFDRSQEITRDHLQGVFGRVSGIVDVAITKVHDGLAFTDRCRQASCYRKDRVLVAGDAAHIHAPLGGQGLNLGLGDAMNLGWKLGATVRAESRNGEAGLTLLDTYEAERYPAATRMLAWTRTQVSAIAPDEHGKALRGFIHDVMKTDDGINLILDRTWGLSQRYDLGDLHPLVGSSAPDLELSDGSRLGDKLRTGRGVLFNLRGDARLKKLIVDGSYEDRVDYHELSAEDGRGLHAFVVRPDGVVAWAADDGGEVNVPAAQAALGRWFGV
ncbi:nitrosoguanidine resistance protein SNG1 [Purpureocillium lavendulum]|uniref:Nitrosoguanidine resistance protein SNG1 n=1 Tax=Purpureocillium lavendulum TaxID=1247861 RepID=A0AB34FKN4_9HYPO|nr:nitrosoguanidine resistance protein SNG1 [Purpureocillium lavendulum]